MGSGTRTRPQREKLIEAARWREINRRGGRWWTGFHRKIRFIAIKEGIEFDGKQDLRDHFSDSVTAFFRLGSMDRRWRAGLHFPDRKTALDHFVAEF